MVCYSDEPMKVFPTVVPKAQSYSEVDALAAKPELTHGLDFPPGLGPASAASASWNVKRKNKTRLPLTRKRKARLTLPRRRRSPPPRRRRPLTRRRRPPLPRRRLQLRPKRRKNRRRKRARARRRRQRNDLFLDHSTHRQLHAMFLSRSTFLVFFMRLNDCFLFTFYGHCDVSQSH